MFASATNVPGTGVATVQHQSRLGQTSYSNADQALQMPTVFETTGSVFKGTRFRIAYNFKAGHSYLIYATVAADVNTVGFLTGPSIKLDINNNGGSGIGSGCTGAETFTPAFGGNPAAIQVSLNNFTEVQFSPFVQGSNQPTLEFTAIPAQNGGSKTIRLRKIRIVETAPPPTFTLTPTSLSIPCGSATTQIFTVNNVHSSPGTLAYDWNLGANNGWIYNGVAAPATFTTTNNSITLVSSATAAFVSNVSVITKLNGTNYPALTAAITIAKAVGNNLSIFVPASVCPTGVISVNNLPVNATVSWQASPDNIVSFPNPATGSPITVTKLTDGVVTLAANVMIAGCPVVYPYSATLTVGSINTAFNATRGGTIVIPSALVYIQPSQTNTLIFTSVSSSPLITFDIQKVYGASPLYVFGNTATFSLGNYSATNPQNGVITILAKANAACSNTTTQAYTFSTKGQCAACGSLFRISPNPATDVVKIEELDAITGLQKTTSTITAIELTDKMGNTVYSKKFDSKLIPSSISIPVAQFQNDIYTLRIFNGTEWEVQQIIIQR